MRVEGDFVKLYYAQNESMKDAALIASVPGPVASLPGVRDAMIMLGRQIVGEIVFEALGIRPVWGEPAKAPEHERAGNA